MKKLLLSLCLFCLGLCCASSLADPNNPKIVMETTYGNIFIELFTDDAPITVDNFLHYVNTGFYDNTLIHRVVTIANSGIGIIQGGGYYLEGNYIYDKPPDRPPIVNESYNGLSNLRGTIAMARTSEPNSATSQFYINNTDNTVLDKANVSDGFGYCVFGKVIYGMEVVDIIADSNTYYIGSGITNFPIPPVIVHDANLAPQGYWLKADLNYDGAVDEQDLTLIADNWLGTAQLGDMEVIGNIDFNEFAKFAQSWKRTSVWYREITADIDNSKLVNFVDFSLFAQDWGKSGIELYGDLNLDSAVNLNDLSLFAEDWLKSAE